MRLKPRVCTVCDQGTFLPALTQSTPRNSYTRLLAERLASVRLPLRLVDHRHVDVGRGRARVRGPQRLQLDRQRLTVLPLRLVEDLRR